MMNKSINRIHDRISPVWDKVREFFLIRMWICGIVIGMERCV